MRIVTRVVLRAFASVLIFAGASMLLLVGAAYAYNIYSEVQIQQRIAAQKPFQHLPVEEPLTPVLPVQETVREVPIVVKPATRLVIPRIGVDSSVIEIGVKLDANDWVWETADHAVGHHLGTPNPGEVGNLVLSGHISSPIRGEGEVFGRLPELEVGDGIIVFSDETQFLYQVIETRIVLPNDLAVMTQTRDQTLTLITCFPNFIYSHRLIVIAKPYYLNDPFF